MEGRLPKALGDALAPLIKWGLVSVTGSLRCDFDRAELFTEIPLLLRFAFNPAVFALPEVDFLTSGNAGPFLSGSAASNDGAQHRAPLPPSLESLVRAASPPFELDNPQLPAASLGFFRLLQWLKDSQETDLAGPSASAAAEVAASARFASLSAVEAATASDICDGDDSDDNDGVLLSAADVDSVIGAGALTDQPALATIVNPPQLSLTLKPFQRHAVAWMLCREASGERNDEATKDLGGGRGDGDRLVCADGPVTLVSTESLPRESSSTSAAAAAPEAGASSTAAAVALWEKRWLAGRWSIVADAVSGEETLQLAEPLAFWVNPYGRRWRVDPPPVPRATAGGILADEMVSAV